MSSISPTAAAAAAAAASPSTSSSSNSSSAASSSSTAGSASAESKVDMSKLITRDVVSKQELLKPIQSLNDAPANVKQNIFIQKLRLCCVMFDWTEDANKDARLKEIKKQHLVELMEFMGKKQSAFSEQALGEIIKMVSVNLFRCLSSPKPPEPGAGGEGDDEEPTLDPAWPHLQLVYEFFLRFIVSSEIEARTLKKYINGPFILRLLDLFDSEDHRERDYLKTILHRIYAKFMSLRAFIRKSINNVFFIFIYETEKHNGIAELLEILGSIINGFALPLKQEHKTFLMKVLTPMHKVRPLQHFHQQLNYCVTQFVEKDPTLSVPLIKGLIKFWPTTNSQKELLFLQEVEELLELTQPEEFHQLTPVLFRQLSKSIGSPHFQVAERALFLWHNEYISGLISENRAQVLPLIYPVLQTNAKHWNSTVSSLTNNVLKIFMEQDQQANSTLVDECAKRYQQETRDSEAAAKQKSEQWSKIEDSVAAELAKIPPPPKPHPDEKLPPEK